MSQITNFFSAFDLPNNIAGDVSLFLLFVGISLAFGFIFGRWKLINILINVYIALAFIGVLPTSLFATAVYSKAIVFILLVIILTAIDERLFDLHISNAGTDFFWRLFVMSILVTGMLVSVILSFLPKVIALGFISVTAYGYFASPLALIFWMVVPLLSLLFINNRLK
ncbi:MAG TPA: hypothetical protein VJH89_01610 [Patescibacteria group bacterium]|nr:hypothetical protein [Patescibacteria group bacterium]